MPHAVRRATSADYSIRLASVSKVYGSAKTAVQALDAVSIELRRGTFTAVMGPSGSGKSTFLNCAAGLDRPTSGSVWLGDVELSRLNEVQLTEVRRQRIGFIFQAYNLLGSLNVEENVTLPLRLADKKTDPEFLREVFTAVGLGEHFRRRPSELSGGQQQRVAIARALINHPDVVVADEPTGALDTRSSKQVLELLRGIVDDMGQTVLMVTHDPVTASYADSVVFLADGRLAGDLPRPTPDQVAARMTHLGEW
ncbi:ABC transporter ATP-binding protein [Micromonospora sp. DT201]|uniref:ABC transporter ATP-binding protein n=1 Tax=Micromonospora sp. DT201 TaxID=3393442 RepID=UPI003CEDCFCE